jgi:hypothetical protein
MDYDQTFEFVFHLASKPIAQARPRLWQTSHSKGAYNPNGDDCAKYRFQLYRKTLVVNYVLREWAAVLGLPEFRTYLPFFRISHVDAVFVSLARQNPAREQIKKNPELVLPNLQSADVDNLLKFALDAGNKTLWHDDHQIWSLSTKKLISSEPSITFRLTVTPDDFIASEAARIEEIRRANSKGKTHARTTS